MTDSYDAQNMAVIVSNLHESIIALRADQRDIGQVLNNIQATLQGISHMLSKEYLLEDIYTNVTLTANELRLDRQGRRFLVIFTPVAINNVPVNVLGIRGYTVSFGVGWTIINLPDGSIIQAPAATNQPIMIKATNWVESGAV